jgi:hypothetical protein
MKNYDKALAKHLLIGLEEGDWKFWTAVFSGVAIVITLTLFII